MKGVVIKTEEIGASYIAGKLDYLQRELEKIRARVWGLYEKVSELAKLAQDLQGLRYLLENARSVEIENND